MSPSSRTTALGRLRPRAHLAAAAFAVTVAVLMLLTPSARAQSSDPLLLLRQVTSPQPAEGKPIATTLDVVYTGDPADLDSAKLIENGNEQTLSKPQPLGGDKSMVFVVATGPNIDKGNLLTKVRDKLHAVVAANPGMPFAVVRAGDRAEVSVDFTTDVRRLDRAINDLAPTKAASWWDGLNLAGSLYEERTSFQRNVMVIVADPDAVATPQTVAVGKTAIISHGVALWPVEYTGPDVDFSALNDLTTTTGGRALAIEARYDKLEEGEDAFFDSDPLALIDQQMQTVTKQQFQLTYNSSVPKSQPITLELTVGDQTVTGDAVSGGGIVRGAGLRPQVASTARTLPFVDNQLALLVALGLAALAVAGIAYAFTLVFVKDDLSNVLSPYAEGYALEEADEDEGNLGKSALIKRAVALTEQVAEQQGLLTRAEAALERANLPLRAGEALFLYLIVVIASALIPLLLWRNLVPVLLFGIVGVLLPPAVVNFLAKRRRKKFMSQLPDTLSLLSGTLRAGYSLMQGVEAVSQEVDEPMGLELRRVVTESRLGRPLEESLESSADRMDSPDFAWAVMAIRIQREVGGNLAELLMTVADTMIARERLRRDVAALTAEGRVSAVILGGLPPALGLIMYVLNPDYVSVLFQDGLGIAMVILAVISMVVGFLWMRKIINIEI